MLERKRVGAAVDAVANLKENQAVIITKGETASP